MSPEKCGCGKETHSFYDVLDHTGIIQTVPCCPRCFRGVRRGHRKTRAGIVAGQTLIVRHNREYTPMGRINWLFYLAGK